MLSFVALTVVNNKKRRISHELHYSRSSIHPAILRTKGTICLKRILSSTRSVSKRGYVKSQNFVWRGNDQIYLVLMTVGDSSLLICTALNAVSKKTQTLNCWQESQSFLNKDFPSFNFKSKNLLKNMFNKPLLSSEQTKPRFVENLNLQAPCRRKTTDVCFFKKFRDWELKSILVSLVLQVMQNLII